MDMKTYLASKYMSGPKADAILSRSGDGKKKKRKHDQPKATAVDMIVDDDSGWAPDVDQTDEPEDVIVASDRSFKKRHEQDNSSSWMTIKEPTPPPAEDEAPLVVDEGPEAPKAGLVTAAQMKRDLAKKKKAEEQKPPETSELEQETVYRDATGRRIDTKAERAAAARLKREREEKEAAKMEWGKGVVQREEEERKRAELALESTRDLARYADDVTINERQKAEERWNDPAAAFLTKKRTKGPRKPEYNGPTPPPNRFGIKPGYRWDGVDRGNGFEQKLYQKANERSRHGAASHNWSVEDM